MGRRNHSSHEPDKPVKEKQSGGVVADAVKPKLDRSQLAEGHVGEKARIVVVATTGEVKETIDCLFNPENYTITKKNKWQPAKTGGSGSEGGGGGEGGGSKPKKGGGGGEEKKEATDTPQLDFGGGGAQVLKVKLFFDTTDTGTNVTDYTQRVFNLMKISGKEPPLCQFIWGTFISPPSVVTDITQKFTYFSRKGVPLRSEMDVTFQEQHQPTEWQNPTSVGPARRTWLVQSGDRLDLIAYEELGEATRWPEIAKMNNLLNPLELQPGQILNIPQE